MKTGKMCCKSCGMSWPRQGGMNSVYEERAMESTPCPACGLMTLNYQSATADKISGLSLAAMMGYFQMQPARS